MSKIESRPGGAGTALVLGCLLLASGLGAQAAVTGVKAVDSAGLKKAISAHKGKVVLMNLWATWCGPCVEEFPSIVKLQNTYRTKGLQVVGVSMDEPENKAAVEQFMAAQKASFPCFMRKSGSVEEFFDPVDKTWTGAVPVTYVFDKTGKLVGTPMVGERSYAQLEAAIKPLVK